MIFAGLAGAGSAIAAACTRRAPERAAPSAPASTTLRATPACDDGDEPTVEQGEGPFFTTNTPERSDLYGDVGGGTKLVLTGTVLATDCRPVEGALLDFWQADDEGNYDTEGYRLRGHQFTDGKGGYELTTVVPAQYSGRTRHIHVKVQAPNGPVLTTQLYFPDEPANDSDGIFSPELVMDVTDDGDDKKGRFTFVVER
jgi:protocatechuate 3,4-dioxygenase beta subunit